MEFGCTGCSLCCRTIGRSIEAAQSIPERSPVQQAMADFPYKTINGVCEKLKDNKCSIYDDRPVVCSVKKTREIFHPEESERDFYLRNAKICNQLILKHRMDREFLIDVRKYMSYGSTRNNGRNKRSNISG